MRKYQKNEHAYSVLVHRDVHNVREIDEWLDAKNYSSNDYNKKVYNNIARYFFHDINKAFAFFCRWATGDK